MEKVKKIFNNIEEFFVVILLLIMTVVVFWQVVCRFVLKASLPWSEELSRYILVWVTFLGASIGVKRGAHIGVEAFLMLLPKQARKFVNYLISAVCVIFCFIVFKESLSIIKMQIANAQVSPAMQIPMWWAYLAIPVGMVLMSIRFIQVSLKLKLEGEV
ncbi:TRAP transporter small permease [Tepidanaerobacter acetatoxydans]|uniref:TRAP transporter small permease n=1 Tax=Tepidanaerobacter acetatoxydans TaxID=499229 RepID=UPI001BD65022